MFEVNVFRKRIRKKWIEPGNSGPTDRAGNTLTPLK
jgi:hypothetical protein